MHTHLEADYAPLESGEIVAIEVGLNPSSALIRKGCRLRIDVQPYSPAGMPVARLRRELPRRRDEHRLHRPRPPELRAAADRAAAMTT